MTANTTSVTLRTKGLCKVYRGRTVVDKVDLELSQGEVVGLPFEMFRDIAADRSGHEHERREDEKKEGQERINWRR